MKRNLRERAFQAQIAAKQEKEAQGAVAEDPCKDRKSFATLAACADSCRSISKYLGKIEDFLPELCEYCGKYHRQVSLKPRKAGAKLTAIELRALDRAKRAEGVVEGGWFLCELE